MRSATTDRCQTRRTLAAAILLAAGGLFAASTLTGCTVTHAPPVVNRVGEANVAAMSMYTSARDQYAAVASRGLLGAELREALEPVRDTLVAAEANPGATPLTAGKLGELSLEVGDIAAGEAAFRRSLEGVAGSREWVPGWIGLAEAARLRGSRQEAEQRLADASLALDVVAANLEYDRSQGLSPGGGARQERQRRIGDVTPTQAESVARLAELFIEQERWPVGNAAGSEPLRGVGIPGDEAAAVRRMRARVELVRARLRLDELRGAGQVTAELVREAFAPVFQADPNFPAAQFEQGRAMLMDAGRPDEADRIFSALLMLPAGGRTGAEIMAYVAYASVVWHRSAVVENRPGPARDAAAAKADQALREVEMSYPANESAAFLRAVWHTTNALRSRQAHDLDAAEGALKRLRGGVDAANVSQLRGEISALRAELGGAR